MITVTERAKQELKTILIASEADPDKGLRLLPSPEGKFVLAVGPELSGDQVITCEGYKVLLVGIEYFRVLDGAMVDCCDTEDGAVLFVQLRTEHK